MIQGVENRKTGRRLDNIDRVFVPIIDSELNELLLSVREFNRKYYF